MAKRWPAPTATVVAAVVLAAQAALLVPWLWAPGAEMDEGGALAYGNLVYDGYLPMRDVRSFYGPLNSYVVGAVVGVFGGNIYAERLLGLAYWLTMAGALLALVAYRGRLAVLCAGVLLVLLPPTWGLSASASQAALAASCLAIALASRRHALASGAAAGVAVGVAVLMRYDFVVPVALASVPWLVAWPWRSRLRALAGFAVTAGLYVPYLAVVGAANVRFSAHLLRIAENARHLPLPSTTTSAGVLFELMLLATAVHLLVGLRRRRTTEGRVFLSVGLLGLGLIPYVTSRADRAHIVIGALAPIVVGTAVVPAAMEELRPYLRRGVRRALTAAIAAGVGLTLVFSVTLLPPKAYAVEYRGRSFPIESRATASAAERALRLADRIAPRDGRLFVGPADLRRTVYADAYMYFLLHRLRPATFFIVLDPGVTELRRHRLARELLNADVLILNRAYDHPTEPNRSRVLGTGAPNRVVDRAFCERGHFGTFLVYARCRHSS